MSSGTVHVFGLPDGTALGEYERSCDNVDESTGVVFHITAVRLSSGGFACAFCGYSTEDSQKETSPRPEGRGLTRLPKRPG